MPSREGERPCRRLALLQPEAQLPVTRVGEQGAPPRRVGRLLSGCGARPPLSPRFDRFRPGRGAGPTLSLHSRYEHSMLAALGVDPDRAHRRPKIFPLAASLFGCSLSEPPGVEQPMRADRKERDRLHQQVDRVCRNAATLRRPWPGAPATGPPQYDRTVSDFLLWKERPGHLHLLPARAGPTRADNHSKVRWSEDVGWLRQLRKALSRSRSQQGGD